jgi:INO80 complex subunit C
MQKDNADNRPSTSQAATLDPELFLPTTLPFKLVQSSERYPKGGSRHWKRLKQIVQGENYHLLPADEPTCILYLQVEVIN